MAIVHVVCAANAVWHVDGGQGFLEEEALSGAGVGVGGLGKSRECSRQGGSAFTGTGVWWWEAGDTVRSCECVNRKAGLWFPCQTGFTHPQSRALTDKRAGSGALTQLPPSLSPVPSPGEARLAPPAPGSGQARWGRAVGLRTEEAPRRPGLQGGLGPRGQGWGSWIRGKVRSHRKWSSPARDKHPGLTASRKSSPEHTSRRREPVGLR